MIFYNNDMHITVKRTDKVLGTMSILEVMNVNTLLRKLFFMTLSITAIAMLTSCTSLRTRMAVQNSYYFDPYSYIGTKENVKIFYTGLIWGSPNYMTRSLLDLPFSFTLDTLLLPTDLIFAPGVIIGQDSFIRYTPKRVTVVVVDEAGLPISDACVGMFVRTGFKWFFTNTDGVLEAEYKANDFRVKKAGYYASNAKVKNEAEGNLQDNVLKVVMKGVINPVPMLIKEVDLPIPSVDEPIGFDFEIGDWTAPHGKGIVEDMQVTVSSNGHVIIDFPNPNDGIQPSGERQQINPYSSQSVFRFPQQAPYTGYSAHNVIYKEKPNVLSGMGFMQDFYTWETWIFRCRAQTSDDGEVLSANYGGIWKVWIARNFKMHYCYNPDSQSRSLESKEIADRQALGMPKNKKD